MRQQGYGYSRMNSHLLGMMPNPSCPHCGGNTRKNGITTAGNQRYRCGSCGRSTNAAGKTTPGPARSGEALSGAERKRRSRARKKRQLHTIPHVE